MRSYIVTVVHDEYTVDADDRYHAAAQAVRLYREAHPTTKFMWSVLIRIVRVRLANPKKPGRKTSFEEWW